MDGSILWRSGILSEGSTEWYRYAGRMAGIEEEMASSRPTNSRGLDHPEEVDDHLPTGVTLEERAVE